MLEHLTPGLRDEALYGDLSEEYSLGRSPLWYWRQVAAAVAISIYRDALSHSTAILFAAIWSMLAPGWVLLVAVLERRFNLTERFNQMDFPWSTTCDMGLILASNLVFLFAGILAYLIPNLCINRRLRVHSLLKGAAATIPALLVCWAALIILPEQFIHSQAPSETSSFSSSANNTMHSRVTEAQTMGQGHWHATLPAQSHSMPLDPYQAIIDFRLWALLMRLPFLACLLRALWAARRSEWSESHEPAS